MPLLPHAGRRILVAVQGTAGDLAPYVPIADRLVTLGHECRLAVPRILGLHLRRLGREHLTIDTGSSAGVLRDDHLVTGRFAGWESWHRLGADHLATTLPADVANATALLHEWRPDVVVTGTLAVAVRVAAHNLGIPSRVLSLHPMLAPLGRGAGPSFARPLLAAVGAAVPASADDHSALVTLAWGMDDATTFLHEPALLEPSAVTADTAIVGYPYWDGFASDTDELADVHNWLTRRARPVVLVTLGSFVGRGGALAAMVDALAAAEVDLLVLSAGTRSRTDRVLTAGFVPLADVAPSCMAAVHHGGLGTTVGVLRAGIPSVMVPRAFDQHFNAARVERIGAGRRATVATLPDVLEAVLDAASNVPAHLVSTDEALRHACAIILAT